MKKNGNSAIVNMVFIAMMAAIMAVCAWITIPAAVPFTLQTFAVFLAICVLGGKNGTIAVLVYILLGAVGLPVFSGFKGGIGVLLGNTGGYIIGFLFSALVMWLLEGVFGRKLSGKSKGVAIAAEFVTMLIGLIVCYAFGTAWFMVVYTRSKGALSLLTCLGWCVFPFIIPDVIKIVLALFIGRRVKKAIGR
ncbi:MAG: biotin transporter BioY [Lachnospiraceae bacterium]|nr:biotin transporter BioY [Lachnospiraceae bacterium]